MAIISPMFRGPHRIFKGCRWRSHLPLRLETLEDRTLPAAPFASTLVASFYQQILSRNAESTGLTLWNNQLTAGTNATQVADAILTSPEARQDQLAADYQSILGRAPDAAGAAFWMQAFQNGASNDQVKTALLGSAEFYAHAGGTPSGFLDQLYQIVLDRAPDAQGLAVFDAALAGANGPGNVASAVMNSTEAHTDELTSLYQNILGRGADNAGMQIWLAQMQAGVSVELIESAFLGSNEYAGRLDLALSTSTATDPNVAAAAFLLGMHPAHTAPTGTTTTSSPGSSDTGTSSPGGTTTTRTSSSGYTMEAPDSSGILHEQSTPDSGVSTSATGDLGLVFDAPALSLSLTPTVTIQATAPASMDSTLSVRIDVDLLHDGSFTDPGDASYATAYVQPNSSTDVTLPALQVGTYTVRATLTDSFGDSTSADAVIDVNPTPTGQGLIFEPNVGQTSSQADFVTRGMTSTAYITPTGPVFSLPAANGSSAPVGFGLQFDGVTSRPEATGTDLLSSYSNYFIGDAPSLWQTNVPNYGGVNYQNVYPGIAVTYQGTGGVLTYDFTVSPGANPGLIAFSGAGAATASVKADGELVLTDASGNELYSSVPDVYQLDASGNRQTVYAAYVSLGGGEIGFKLGSYDATRPLIIDPTIVYSTFIGGSMDEEGNGIAVDSAGDAYVVGSTSSTDYPLVNPVQNTNGAATEIMVVTKVDPTGKNLLYSTYVGGDQDDFGYAIALDSSDNVYITADSFNDTDYPTTPGAFETTAPSTGNNAVVTKLNSTGNALDYSTFLTGSGSYGRGIGIAVDSAGDAYVTGDTGNTLTTTTNAFQTDMSINASTGRNLFVAELNPSGSGLVYSTYVAGTVDVNGNPVTTSNIGSQGNAIAVDSSGNAYVTGITDESDFPTMNAIQSSLKGNINDAFVFKLSPGGTSLIYSTYLGGATATAAALAAGSDSSTNAYGIAINSAGDAYIVGFSDTTDYPTTAGAYTTVNTGNTDDVIVSELNPTGTAFVYSTFIGDPAGEDDGYGIALDNAGDATVVGQIDSDQFPQMNALQLPATGANSLDGFITTLNPTGTALVFSTNFGGYADDGINAVAVDSTGSIYVTGMTDSTMGNDTTSGMFPIVNAFQPNNAGGQDIFVAKVTPPGTAGGITGGGGTPTGGSTPAPIPGPVPIVADPYRTSEKAFDYGSMATGTTLSTSSAIGDTSDGLPSYDWYRYEPAANGTLTVTMNVTGTGSTATTTPMDLELHIFTLQGPEQTLVELTNDVTAGVLDKTLTVTASPGEPLLVEIKGRQIAPGEFTFGTYNLSVTLN